MRVLLDTHALIWLVSGDERLPMRARRLIETEADATFASAASAWEIATKFRLGKLPSASGLARNFAGLMRAADLKPLAITVEHGEMAGRFDDPHKDPFGRMLIAQALADDLVLVSNETVFDRFGVNRLW